jgi:adenylosuccinate lyase
MNQLTNISPIDGRYHNQTKNLSVYFSELALIKYRVKVEIEYFISLNETLKLTNINSNQLRDIYINFNEQHGNRIKEIEKETNHDVKAVEYFIKQEFDKIGLSDYKEFVHFGLTSQDVNNTAIPLLLKDWFYTKYIPSITNLTSKIRELSKEWHNIPMLAHTHGQPASPTRLGKELMVFVERLDNQIDQIHTSTFSCKFGGATGNLNAHHVAYPHINWVNFANNFTKELGLTRMQYTTQIEHYDSMASLFDNIKRINTILIDFCRDMWQYISMEYFKQKTKDNEVGSSAMPHKVNPIDFENAEGNLGLSNAILSHLSEKLPISRLQRDLTDSTVLRNIGVPISHLHISIESILKGLNKLILNKDAIIVDLDNNWSVVAEGIQTILRRERYPNPYETLKSLTRGKEINQETISIFIEALEVSNSIKEELKRITPFNYTGV